MPLFVEDEVAEIAEDSTESGNIELLIGYKQDSSTAEEIIKDAGGEIVENLPFDTLTATVPSHGIGNIIDHEQIETVEMNSGVETLEGN